MSDGMDDEIDEALVDEAEVEAAAAEAYDAMEPVVEEAFHAHRHAEDETKEDCDLSNPTTTKVLARTSTSVKLAI